MSNLSTTEICSNDLDTLALNCQIQYLDDIDPFSSNNSPEPRPPPSCTFLTSTVLSNQLNSVHRTLKAPHRITDCTLQLYRQDGNKTEFGPYLDLDQTLDEQREDIESFTNGYTWAVVLRTRLDVRVHACIDKLLNSDGWTLRRSLSSLKRVFKDDEDLVHEFVNNQGLECLLQIGGAADQNTQNYVLGVFGELMLYVDGMNAVINQNEVIQWLYTLVESSLQLVLKTSLKLLLLFAKYRQSNALLILSVVTHVDRTAKRSLWSNAMKILNEMKILYEMDNSASDVVLLIITLFNTVLSVVPDLDTFYDMTDALENQGIQRCTQFYLNKTSVESELVEQFNIYDAALRDADNSTGVASIRRASQTKGTNERVSDRYRIIDCTSSSNPAENSNNRAESSNDPQENSNNPPETSNYRQENPNNPAENSNDSQENSNNLAQNSNDPQENSNEPPESANDPLENSNNPQETSNDTQENSNDPQENSHNPAENSNYFQENSNNPQENSNNPPETSNDPQENSNNAQENSNNPQEDSNDPEDNKEKVLHSTDSTMRKNNDRQRENIVREVFEPPLRIKHLNFEELDEKDDINIMAINLNRTGPPPPPPMMIGKGFPSAPPPPPPLPPPISLQNPGLQPANTTNRAIVRWRKIVPNTMPTAPGANDSLWTTLNKVKFDTTRFKQSFQPTKPDVRPKTGRDKPKIITFLDARRSNNINFVIKRLPTAQAIKEAILKMDISVINKENIEQLLKMLPTEEEKKLIKEAETANSDVPFDSAEQFLSTLASVVELKARLELWLFKLNFDNIELEIAEPLMDLKNGMRNLKENITFRHILEVLLAVGNFLNGDEAIGFQLDCLANLSKVKDTNEEDSLLVHVSKIILEMYPDTSDFYSEIGEMTQCSEVDFDELEQKLNKLENDYRAALDHLQSISKHEASQMKTKLTEFLADCAKRICLLRVIHRRVLNRFQRFLLWLGYPRGIIQETKITSFCKILSEFASEYRETRKKITTPKPEPGSRPKRQKTGRISFIDVQSEIKPAQTTPSCNLEAARKSTTTNDQNLQGSRMQWKYSKNPSNKPSVSLPSTVEIKVENESFDSSDELLDNLVKNPLLTRTKHAITKRKPAGYAQRQSWRRTLLQINLNDEERAAVFDTNKK